MTDDIYRFFNFYDIKRSGGGEAEKPMSSPNTILYELILVFQYFVEVSKYQTRTWWLLRGAQAKYGVWAMGDGSDHELK